jgi:hypothetical protein
MWCRITKAVIETLKAPTAYPTRASPRAASDLTYTVCKHAALVGELWSASSGWRAVERRRHLRGPNWKPIISRRRVVAEWFGHERVRYYTPFFDFHAS